ncbi:MAG: hypothetical protein R3F62_07890 [Planctomycetota bacterium]
MLGLLLCAAAWAQEDPKFGMEFEFAGRGNRIVRFEDMPWENYERLMRVVVEHYGGDPETIRRVDFTKATSLPQYPDGQRPVFRAEWTDPQGGTWRIEPEYVATRGLDGYELVTPVLEDTRELERILEKLEASGLVREGLKSGVHVTVDGSGLVDPRGDARGLANLIVLHENFEPLLRRMFDPVRGGGHSNRFARSLAVDHPELIEAIGNLSERERTVEKLTELFARFDAREAQIQGSTIGESSQSKMWKYRSLNLAKALPINSVHDGSLRLVEFRMFDLGTAEAHRLQAQFYRRLVRHAQELAARGEVVRFRPRAAMPLGEDPSLYNTPEDPREAKRQALELVAELGLDPQAFEPLLERTIRGQALPSRAEFAGMVEALSGEGSAAEGGEFRFRFELSGRGWGVISLLRPVDAAVEARWDALSTAEKRAYFEAQTAGDLQRGLRERFRVDQQRHPWLRGQLTVEADGSWRIGAEATRSLSELQARLEAARVLGGRSGQQVELIVEDLAPKWSELQGKRAQVEAYFDRVARWAFVRDVETQRPGRALEGGSTARVEVSDLSRPSQQVEVRLRGTPRGIGELITVSALVTHQLRAHGWGDLGGPRAEAVESLVDHYERYLQEVEGERLSPERRRIVEGIESGRLGDAARAVAAPLEAWTLADVHEETTRRAIRYAREEYLSWLHREVQRIEAGGYGYDPSLVKPEALRAALELTPAEATALPFLESPSPVGRATILQRLGASAVLGAADRAKLAAAPVSELARMDATELATGLVHRALERATALLTLAQRAGVSAAGLSALRRLEGVNWTALNAAELRAAGLEAAQVERLLELEARLAPFDGARLQRTLRERVRTWFAESGLRDVLLRSLLPRAEGKVEATPTEPRTLERIEVDPRAPVIEVETEVLEPRRGEGSSEGRGAGGEAERAATIADLLAPWRRSNGRVDWKRFSRERVKVEAAGLAHFGLGLFLKELAVAVKSGDRLYVEEFFDALLTTDFYAEYGLFVLGARVAEGTYTRYLQRYVKPNFVNSVLKTNLVLATGLALPAIVHGRFEGKTFAISLGSLGLSTALVQGGTRGLKWVVDLRKARTVGTAARTGLALKRLTRAGAWFYSAAELAVILYAAEEFEHAANGFLDRMAARRAIGEAGVAFLQAARAADATPESLTAACEAYDEAWTTYRDFLYKPLFAAESRLAGRMHTLAEDAKELDDERKEAVARLSGHARLRARVEQDYGSLENYAQSLVDRDERSLQGKLDQILASYDRERTAQLREVYDGERRAGRYLTVGVDQVRAASGPGALVVKSQLRERVSPNRLQAYEDELEVLRLALELRRDRPELVEALAVYAERVEATHAADDQLAHGDQGILDTSALRRGLTDAVEGR